MHLTRMVRAAFPHAADSTHVMDLTQVENPTQVKNPACSASLIRAVSLQRLHNRDQRGVARKSHSCCEPSTAEIRS